MAYCPSQDWDRHCAQMDQPVPAGNSRQVHSRKRQHCESCWIAIEPGTKHLLQPMLNDAGLFCTPLRFHLPGECRQIEGSTDEFL